MRRVLFCDHPESDYLAAMLHLGLCQVLGPENVVDYPYKRSYHGETHRYPSVYATDPGSSEHRKWLAGETPMGVTSPFDWYTAQPAREWSRQEVIDNLHGFELVVLASPRKNNGEALDDLIRARGRHEVNRLAFVDGEDYAEIRWDVIERFAPEVCFKRELVPGVRTLYPAQEATMRNRVRFEPLPFGYPGGRLPAAAERDVDVVMLSSGSRPGGLGEWEAAVRRVTSSVVTGRISRADYLATLARAKIIVVPRGHGWDTLRLWESLACEGAMVLVERSPRLMPDAPVDGLQWVSFASADELSAAVRSYLLNTEGAREIVARNGNALLWAKHTVRARAEFLLEKAL